ncbi:unnamed protein product [Cylindrotheca closterium]|uniref:Orc1-like AAA ATPase domain-containing protein n=1 Tax=Cylindrotheca closterium TaxID=2856 RepID=A0AAD2FNV0_9STRA|nr:unnamed protein product [Cylindrotheca closterium]
MQIPMMKEYTPPPKPPPPVQVDQEISIPSDHHAGAPSVFGDEDALLSVTSEAYEVSTKHTDRSGSNRTRYSQGSYYTMDSKELKASELRPKSKEDPAMILGDPNKDSHSGSRYGQDKPLNIASNRLVARDKEIATLKACFQRLMSNDDDDEEEAKQQIKNKELVLISGQSGVGKTSVVQTLEDDDIAKSGICITGKFTMTSSNRPYLGISDALNKAFQTVIGQSKNESVSKAIQDELNQEVPLLRALVPCLREILGNTESKAPADLDYEELENGLERLKYAFRFLIRVLCQEFTPFLLVLDDLQWADIQSLQVLDSLISDINNENKLMIVGTYRSDEVDENSLLYNKIMALHEKEEDFQFRITTIKLNPFSVDDIDRLIQTAISSTEESSQIKDLSELCLKRTHGNPFFVIEFLKMLHTERLLVYDSSKEQWDWTLSTIEDSTMSTANVVVLLHERMAKMPKQVQIILQYAAYLGSSFREATLELIWSTYGTMRALGNKEPLSNLLAIIIRESFFEKIRGGYRWVHDKVQEAALYFTGDVRPTVQLDIGTTLYYCLKAEQLEDDIFNVVDLINNGNAKKRPEFANVNLRAAEKARGISAFQAAAKYASHGMELLTDTRWSDNRSLTLKLYTMAVEMEMILGHTDVAEKYREEILKNGNYTVTETLPLKLSKAQSLAVVALHFDEAVGYCLSVLKELDCRLIVARALVPVQMPIKLLSTMSKVKKLDVDFFKGMGTMSDPKLRAIASITNYVKYAAFVGGDLFLSLICICKLTEMTLKHGLNEFSGITVASLGMTALLVQQDCELADKIMQMALSIQEQLGKTRATEVLYTSYAFGWPWLKPLRDSLDPMRRAYTVGVQTGEMVHAMWGLMANVIMIPYALGTPIETIVAECAGVVAQADEAKQMGQALDAKVFWQMLLNLNLSTKDGGAKLEGKMYSKANDNNDFTIHLSTVHLCEGELLIFHGEYEAAAERAISKGDLFAKQSPLMFFNMSETFNRGVALYVMAQKTNKRVYKKEAKSIRKQVDKWAKSGNPNVGHFSLLLQAEQEALEKKHDAADESYRKAITAATKGNYLQYMALFHERYSDFLLNVQSSKEDSAHHLNEAARYFEEWGATTRAQSLRDSLK